MLLVRKFFRRQNVFATVIQHLIVKWFVYMWDPDRQHMYANYMARYFITIVPLIQAKTLT